jgi:hypothetical protein
MRDTPPNPTGIFCACGNEFMVEPEPHPEDQPSPRDIGPPTIRQETRFGVFSEVRDYYPSVTMMCGECADAVSKTLESRWRKS